MGIYYSNYKYVAIYDRSLALLWYICICAVLGFVVCHTIILNKGYLEYEAPIGTVRFRLHKMLNDQKPSDFPYCEDSACVIWDQYDVSSADETGSNSLFIATAVDKVFEELQEREELDSAHVHRWFKETNRSHHRIVGIEDFVLKIEHSYEAPKLHSMEKNSNKDCGGVYCGTGSHYAHSQRSITGYLNFKDGSPPLVFTQKKPDVITIGTLLQAANVTLNAPSDRVQQKLFGQKEWATTGESADMRSDGASRGGGSMSLTQPNKKQRLPFYAYNTMRDRGLSLVVTITYDNTKGTWFGVSTPIYTYEVHRIPEAEYEIVQSVSPPSHHTVNDVEELYSGSYGQPSRILHHKYGLHVAIVQTGRLAKFSYSQLLIQLASGMGLLALGATVVEYLAFYIMPKRQEYRLAMVEHSKHHLKLS